MQTGFTSLFLESQTATCMQPYKRLRAGQWKGDNFTLFYAYITSLLGQLNYLGLSLFSLFVHGCCSLQIAVVLQYRLAGKICDP